MFPCAFVFPSAYTGVRLQVFSIIAKGIGFVPSLDVYQCHIRTPAPFRRTKCSSSGELVPLPLVFLDIAPATIAHSAHLARQICGQKLQTKTYVNICGLLLMVNDHAARP